MNKHAFDRNDLIALMEASRKTVSSDSDPLLHPAPGQFHPLALETDMWEAFVLVLERNGDICQVIPGSMDPLKGGPSDILVPAPGNHDQYWTLNLGLKQELPAGAMLPGFASLTPGLLNYVKYGLNKFELGEPLGDKFRFCLPYIGKSDSRRMYRDELAALMEKANSLCGRTSDWTFSANSADEQKIIPLLPMEEEYAFAAGKERGMKHINCKIENFEEFLSMKYDPDKNTVWIFIFTEDKKFSSVLDGMEIIDAGGSVLGTIQNGKCILNVNPGFDGSIALRTSDGRVCLLKNLS